MQKHSHDAGLMDEEESFSIIFNPEKLYFQHFRPLQ